MKSFLFSFALILGWLPSPSTNVVSYHLYWGPAHSFYTNSVNCGSSLLFTNQFQTGLYYFAVTASSTNEESLFSDELIWSNVVQTNLAQPRIGIRWTNHTVFWLYDPNVCDRVEWSDDAQTWTEISSLFMVLKNGEWVVSFSTAGRPVRFFRLKRYPICLN